MDPFWKQIIALIVLALPVFAIPAILKMSSGLLGRIHAMGHGFTSNRLGANKLHSAHRDFMGRRAKGLEARMANSNNGVGQFIGGYRGRRKFKIDQQNASADQLQRRALANTVLDNDKFAQRAAGIGGEEALERVQGTAASALLKERAESAANRTQVLNFRADQAGMVTKTFAQQVINTAANSGVGSEYSFTDRNGNEVKIKTDPSLLTAIGEFAANTGEVTQLEDLRGIAVKPNGTYNAQMTSALQRSLDDSIRRNDGTVKSKGGFHLATDFNLALDKIMDANPGMSLDQAQNTLKLNMDIGRLGSLAGSSSMDIGSMKMGEFVRMKDALNNEAAKNALSQTELDLIKGTLADVFKSPGARSNATDRMHLVVQAAESLGVAVPSDLAASASHGGGATPSGEAGTS